MKVRKAHNLFVEMDRDSDGRLDRSEMDLFFKAKVSGFEAGRGVRSRRAVAGVIVGGCRSMSVLWSSG